MKAYRTANSPLLYDIEALGIELHNRSMWGTDPTGLNMNGKTWFEWKDWVERQARLESASDRSSRGGSFGRDTVKTEALAILQDLESRGHAVFTSNRGSSTEDNPTGQGSVSSLTPSKGEIKRARKRLTEALTDPVIGPALNRLHLGEVCRTLVPAPIKELTRTISPAWLRIIMEIRCLMIKFRSRLLITCSGRNVNGKYRKMMVRWIWILSIR